MAKRRLASRAVECKCQRPRLPVQASLDRPDPRRDHRTEMAQERTGFVDSLIEGTLHGWAWAPSRPAELVMVDLFDDTQLITTVRADRFRPDLLAAGIGDGSHSFEVRLPEDLLR